MKIEFFSFPKNKGAVARAIRMIDECEGKGDGTKFAVVTYFLGDEGCSLRMLDDGESIEDAAEREVFWRDGENHEYDRVVISQNVTDDGYIISLYRTDEESDDPWCKVFLVPVENHEYDRVVISQNITDDGYIISLYCTDEDDPWCKVFLVPVENWAKKENKEVEA